MILFNKYRPDLPDILITLLASYFQFFLHGTESSQLYKSALLIAGLGGISFGDSEVMENFK